MMPPAVLPPAAPPPAAPQSVIRQRAGLDVPDDQIHTADVPTGPRPGLFFSHRSQQPCGRFALAARLRPRGVA